MYSVLSIRLLHPTSGALCQPSHDLLTSNSFWKETLQQGSPALVIDVLTTLPTLSRRTVVIAIANDH